MLSAINVSVTTASSPGLIDSVEIVASVQLQDGSMLCMVSFISRQVVGCCIIALLNIPDIEHRGFFIGSIAH